MRRRDSSGAWALAALLCVLCVDAAATDGAASKPVARLADGHPDLSGTWDDGAGIDFIHPQKSANGTVCISGCDSATPRPPPPANAPPRPAPNVPKYKPQFLAKVADLDKRQVATDPVLRCKSPGVPRIGPPAKIRDGLDAWREAGIRTPVVVPLSADGDQNKALAQVFAAFAE